MDAKYSTGRAIKDVKYVHHMDLERIIEAEYGKTVDIQACEYSQDSIRTFDVGDEPSKYGDEGDLTVEQWLRGETVTLYGYEQTEPSPADVCHDLYKRGKIPAGGYVVHIWW